MIGRRGGWGGDEGGRGRRAALTLLLVGAAACGGGKATGGSGGSSGTMTGIGSTNGMDSDGGISNSLWPVMSPAQVSVQGGTALAASGPGLYRHPIRRGRSLEAGSQIRHHRSRRPP